jgi:hypothetical protein
LRKRPQCLHEIDAEARLEGHTKHRRVGLLAANEIVKQGVAEPLEEVTH